MKREEFDKIISIIHAFWPLKFNDEKLKLLWSRCGERCTYQEMGEALKKRMLSTFPTDVAEIISATGEIINSNARKICSEKQKPGRICSQCENSGWVQALDPDGYSFAFRCHCPPAMEKGISSSIPLWEEKYEKMGYKRIVYKKSEDLDREDQMKKISQVRQTEPF